jgi:hypothetical protein
MTYFGMGIWRFVIAEYGTDSVECSIYYNEFHVISYHFATIALNKVLAFQNRNQQCEQFGYLLLAMMLKDHVSDYFRKRGALLSRMITRVDPVLDVCHVLHLALHVGKALWYRRFSDLNCYLPVLESVGLLL